MGIRSRFGVRPSTPHILTYARGSWQRLGHLKMLCTVASPSNSMNLEGITSLFQASICSLVPIPSDLSEQVTEYIKNHRYNQYDLKKGLPVRIELQDYYLADSRLPSQVGALTGRLRAVDYLHMEYVEIPAWAVRLKLLREGNYTLTDRGKILLIPSMPGGRAMPENDNKGVNPFVISDGERFLFLYCLLEADGDIIKRLYGELLEQDREITVGIVRGLMLDVLKKLPAQLTPRFGRLLSSTETGHISSMTKTLERGSDQIVIPRLEPYVDCGIVRRAHRQYYTYRLSDHADSFLGFLREFEKIDDFLEKGLAKACTDLLGVQSCRSTERIRHYIADSYLKMRSGLGYCSIRELAMLAVACAINKHDCFEIDDVEQDLLSLSRKHGMKVRFTKNRQGDIALVRIDRGLAESLYAVSGPE